MLTVMSVAPIISVLFVSLMRKPAKKAAAGLARISKLSLNKVSRGGRCVSVFEGCLYTDPEHSSECAMRVHCQACDLCMLVTDSLC